MLSNVFRFDSSKFGDEAFVNESVLEWITLNTQSVVSFPYSLMTTNILLEDA